MQKEDMAVSKPNILYIHTHDTGRHIQPYGHAIPTPNLQQLAEEGVLFRQAFCVTPSCSPSRACLLTGQYHHNNGMFGLSHVVPDLVDIGGFSLKDPKHHILYTLRDAGYATVLTGVEHIVDLSNDAQRTIGYDQVIGTRANGEESAVQFLDNAPPEPFFLAVGFNETHRDFKEPGPDENPNYCLPASTLPDTSDMRRDMAGFKASARVADAKMGKVFDALTRNGLYENTLIICTTDHGAPFPHMKGTLYDGGTGVFLIMKGPGGFEGGKVIDALVSHLDIFPTVCDLAGITPPSWLEGKSLTPMIRGKKDEIHDAIFTELTYHRVYEPLRCIRTERWKYIRRFDFTARGPDNSDPRSPGAHLWVRHGWYDKKQDEEELYNLILDPHEMINLVGSPGVEDIRQDLRDRLERWMKETGDPLRHGPIPGPDGTRIRDRDRP